MSEMGDDFRAMRQFKQDARRHHVECDSPGCQFGGSPVKNPPGTPCRRCGRIASGVKGSDLEYARREESKRFVSEAEKDESRARNLRERTCTVCGCRLKTKLGRMQHERDVHGHPPIERERHGASER